MAKFMELSFGGWVIVGEWSGFLRLGQEKWRSLILTLNAFIYRFRLRLDPSARTLEQGDARRISVLSAEINSLGWVLQKRSIYR
ncbi:hypothetical protein [Geothrix sp. 21YS21S-2]|uniref:hypothetical protein n=1 Tax=Geothrix sp. 21YS21S-2 TaxID=3068893 RepID=UPI0027BA216A|nr:hypothetical protein [Geothrix sp. 21YS21S-2]